MKPAPPVIRIYDFDMSTRKFNFYEIMEYSVKFKELERCTSRVRNAKN